MVEHAWHVQCVATLLDQIQRSTGNPRAIAIEAIIETPLGLENLREIAQVSPRLEALSFGAGDYAAAMHMKNHIVGAPDSSYRIRPGAEFWRIWQRRPVWRQVALCHGPCCKCFARLRLARTGQCIC